MREGMVRDLTPEERERFGVIDRTADAIFALIQQDHDLRNSPGQCADEDRA